MAILPSLLSQPALKQKVRSVVAARSEVVVCGGGPAGIAAALSAARSGVKVTLIENQGCLGGIWTSGLLSWIIDHENKGGIMREIKGRLRELGGLALNRRDEPTSAYDPEIMKFLLEEMLSAAEVQIRLYTRIVSTVVDSSNRLTHVVTESKSGREAWPAHIFIDATGDGDVAAYAGCRFEVGRPGNGETQPMSLMALLAGVDHREIAPFYSDEPELQEEAKKRLLHLLQRQGCPPSYSAPTLFRIHDGLFALMATHQYNRSAIDARDLTQATLHARKELHAIMAALRRSGSHWSNAMLVTTGAQIGVREGRRIRGRVVIGAEDLVEGRQAADPICDVTFNVDIHSTNPSRGKAYGTEGIRAKPYQIPLKAAIAADVDGLMLAGRCISGDFFAHASYRVTGNAVQMGENVGRVAAQCCKDASLPNEALELLP